MTYNIVQLIALSTLAFTTGYGIATAIGIWRRLDPDRKNRELKIELEALRREFHRHVELYGDKTRLKWGEEEKRYEEMHFKLIPDHLRTTTEDVEGGRIARARVMAELKERFSRDWRIVLHYHVERYGDRARTERGEPYIGIEPRILTILFGPDYQQALEPELFLSHPDPRIEGDPIPKSLRITREEALAAGVPMAPHPPLALPDDN